MTAPTFANLKDAGSAVALAMLASGKNPDGTTIAPTTPTWTETATADNAAATATRPAVAGQSHYITSVSGSFSAAAIKLMTLKDATVVEANFPRPQSAGHLLQSADPVHPQPGRRALAGCLRHGRRDWRGDDDRLHGVATCTKTSAKC
jgi:hypothetical protein